MSRPDQRTKALKAQLAGHQPRSQTEEACVRLMLAALEVLDSPFARDAGGLHFTASALVFSPAGVLLHHHLKAQRWLQPGGHIDPGETPAQAAVREVLEESGVKARVPETRSQLVHVDVHDSGAHTHMDLRYLFVSDATLLLPAQGESDRLQWFAPSELVVVEPTVRHLVEVAADLLGTVPGWPRFV